MSSTLRRIGYRTASQRPTVGDTKTSLVNADHMGWLKCDARQLSPSSYPQLFNVIGYSFGRVGDDFLLPNPDGRAMAFIGKATPTGHTWNMGDLSGQETHTLTIAQLPAHNHDISGGYLNVSGGVNPSSNGNTSINGLHTHTGLTNESVDTPESEGVAQNGIGTAQVSGSVQRQLTFTTDPSGNHRHQIASNGGGQAHNNIQPTIWLGYLYIYGGKYLAGSDGLNAPFSRNKFPNFAANVY